MPARLESAIQTAAAENAAGGRLFRAPARINIIGEHTDYNDGLVLPTTTALFTWLHVVERADRRVQVKSLNLDQAAAFRLDELEPVDEVSWIDYVRGVAAELEGEGVRLCGANILVDSDIPLGSGLSSSAALELASAQALLGLAGRSLPAERLADLCQRAERRYAKVQCGIMDQFTIACARKGHAVLLDCRSLQVTQVPIPEDFGFLVVDSGVRHRLPDGDYNCRADECAAALKLLAAEQPQIKSLRDLDRATLERCEPALGDVLYRRCRHLVSENERVRQAVTALRNHDARALGSLLNDCHASLRDDYAISCPEVDTLVATANSVDGVLGSRMVGGGFGGCVLVVTVADDIAGAAEQIRERCAVNFGSEPWMHIVSAAGPAREISES
jgi:galactokinase